MIYYSQKRQTEWTGYKVHLTQTCDEDMPDVIADVQTTPAPRSDYDLLPTIQTALATRELLPAEQLVDTGYVSAEHIVISQREHQVTVLAPSTQTQAGRPRLIKAFMWRPLELTGKCTRLPVPKVGRAPSGCRDTIATTYGHQYSVCTERVPSLFDA
jgi:hypothetical protein